MLKLADDIKLCHRAKNPDDLAEQYGDINKLVEWTNKGQINFYVDKCPVMHIGHKIMQCNYCMSMNSCRQQIFSGI